MEWPKGISAWQKFFIMFVFLWLSPLYAGLPSSFPLFMTTSLFQGWAAETSHSLELKLESKMTIMSVITINTTVLRLLSYDEYPILWGKQTMHQRLNRMSRLIAVQTWPWSYDPWLSLISRNSHPLKHVWTLKTFAPSHVISPLTRLISSKIFQPLTRISRPLKSITLKIFRVIQNHR